MQAVVADYRRIVRTAQLTDELVCESSNALCQPIWPTMSTPTLVDLTFERPNNRQISITT